MPTATQPQPAPQSTLAEKVIDLVGFSNAALEKAAAVEARASETRTKLAKLIPQVVEVMVQQERVTPDQREKLATALKDPVRVLELLGKVAAHRNTAEQTLGRGVKTAGDNHSARQTVVGQRQSEPSEADVAFCRALGIAPTPAG